MTTKKKKAERAGRFAEWAASVFLRCKGYRILERGYRTAFGEIDILARRGHTLIAVEVKLRPTLEAGLQAISPKQQQRIARTLETYISGKPHYYGFDRRMDALILVRGIGWPVHVKNAW